MRFNKKGSALIRACLLFTSFLLLFIASFIIFVVYWLENKDCCCVRMSLWLSLALLFTSLVSLGFLVTRGHFTQVKGHFLASVEPADDVAFEYFITVLVPLVAMNDVASPHGSACYWLSLILVMVLSFSSRVCWKNPALLFLGFHFYSATVKSVDETQGGGSSLRKFTLISRAKLSAGKEVSLDVLDAKLAFCTIKENN